jgi:hypothetical protein
MFKPHNKEVNRMGVIKKYTELDWKEKVVFVGLARYLQEHPETVTTSKLSDILKELPVLSYFDPTQRDALLTQWSEDTLRQYFRPQGVINPKVFTDILGRSFIFYVLDSKDQYLVVRDLVAQQEALLSIHRIFGDDDLLILTVVSSEDKRLEEFESQLNKWRLGVRPLEVEDILRYRSCEVQEIPKGFREVNPQWLSDWGESIDAYATEYTEAKRRQLQPETRLRDRRYLLGVSWNEDFTFSGRVRAFVALHFRERLPKETERQVPTILMEIESLRSHLVSIYKLKPGVNLEFLLEIHCDTYGELDQATDDLIELSRFPVETLTFPVAGTVRDRLPTVGPISALPRVLAAVWGGLNPALREKLQGLPREDAVFVALKDTLDDVIPEDIPSAKRASQTEERQIYEIAGQFTRATLEPDRNDLFALRNRLFTLLESKLRDVCTRIIERDYQSREQEAFSTLGLEYIAPLAWERYQVFLDKWIQTNLTAPLKEEWNEVNNICTSVRAERNRQFHGLARGIDEVRLPFAMIVWSVGRQIADTVFCIRWLASMSVNAKDQW